MSKAEHIKQKNRSKNAGGVYPDAMKNMVALNLIFGRQKNNKLLIVWLYLWLTQQLNDIQEMADIPDLFRVKGSDDCQKDAFRLFNDGSISWVE